MIVPAFNAAPTLRAALQSTLLALPRSGKVLLLDDGSTDDTLEIAGSVRDSRLKTLSGQGNRGVSTCLNELLDMVDTPLVARMDADDICLPWRFSSQLRTLRKGDDVVYTSIMPLQGRRPALPHLPAPITPAAFGLHLLLDNPVAHSTMAARTSVLRAAGGYRDVAAEDYDLWLRLASTGARMRRLATVGLAYRRHAHQVSGSAEWQVSALAEPRLREARRDLAQVLLEAGAADDPDRLLGCIWDAADRLPLPQRQLLRSKVRARRSVRSRDDADL